MAFCDSCGHELRSTAKFCGACGTKTPKPARQDLDDYESQYIARQGQRPSPKPAETRQTSAFCDSCGAKLKPAAKFCGKCGSKQ